VRVRAGKPEPAIGVIGGSGLYEMEGLEEIRWVKMKTPFAAFPETLATENSMICNMDARKRPEGDSPTGSRRRCVSSMKSRPAPADQRDLAGRGFATRQRDVRRIARHLP